MRRTTLVAALAALAAVACETEPSAPFDHVALLLHLDTTDTSPDAATDLGPRDLSAGLHGDIGWAESPSGLGLDLGASGYLSVPDLGSPGLDSADWTAVLDVRLDLADTAGNRAILQSTAADGSLGRTLLYVSPDCGGALGSLVGDVPVCGTTALTPDTWTQVAVSYDRTTDHLQLFVDGVLDGEGRVEAVTLGEGLLVGVNRSLTTQHLQGAVDELLVLTESLDEAGLAERVGDGGPWAAPVCSTLPADPWLWLEADGDDMPWRDMLGESDGTREGTCSLLTDACDPGFVSVPAEHLPPLAGADFTVALRARLDAEDPTDGDRTLVQVPDGRTLLYSDASCDGALATYLGGAELCGGDLVPGREAHVALSYSAETQLVSVYLDGLLTAASVRDFEGGQEGLLVGVGRDLSSQAWEGLLDDLLVWDRALTPAEVGDVAAAGRDLCVP